MNPQNSEWFRSVAKTGSVLVLVVLSSLVFVWLIAPERFLQGDKRKAVRISCVNNLKQIGLGFRQWAIDYGDQFPFNVSTSAWGTMELSLVDKDGFAHDPAIHLCLMSNEFTTPKILVCPKDKQTKPAAIFSGLRAENVTYRLRSGTNLSPASAGEILMVCPVDGNVLYCNGTVGESRGKR